MRKLLLITLLALLVCQFGFAQATGPNIQKLAVKAAQTPSGIPVVPAGSIQRGYMRPHIWVAAQLSQGRNVGPLVQGLPSFCNVLNTRGGFNWCPNALQVAYGALNIMGAPKPGQGLTIAIADAFHYKNVKSDLDFFNNEMGLPPLDCQNGNGCFSNLDQNGNDAKNTTCGSDTGWELETMLDVEWAHAMAPYANIMLVEGCTNQDSDLAQAVLTAVRLGAAVVSNSYGEDEFVGESAGDFVYNQNVPIMFSSGDTGAAGKGYPCASTNATCVGGTRLMPVSTTDFHRGTETGWTGSGGGCALPEEPQPPYQSNNGVTACPTRAMPDIAADADGNTGVIVYDSGNGGHFRVGGTSVSCPVTAGLFAGLDTARRDVVPTFLRKPLLAGAASASFVNNGLYLKYAGHNTGNPYAFYYFDILTGNNGLPAGPGYDLVTGLGVLNTPHAGPPWNLP